MKAFSLLVLAAAAAHAQEDDLPVVDLPDGSGTVSGYWTETYWGKNTFAVFKGIPYATPPLGELRFLPPLPNEPWEGTLSATSYAEKCSQRLGGEPQGQEDCLYLNVHATSNFLNDGEDLVPVMVFFHAGGLSSGSAAVDFYLVDYDVVVITVAYRLAQFGFVSLGEASDRATGNQGLRDQNLALKWIRSNVAAFGGDPDRVTLFGDSAGSWSVFHHMWFPESEGLFQSVIGQSGTPMGDLNQAYRTADEDIERGMRLLTSVGCDNSTDAFSCLQSSSWEDIMSEDFVPRGSVDFEYSDNPVLPGYPEDLMTQGDFYHVPVMLGVCAGESVQYIHAILEDPDSLDIIDEEWYHYGPQYILEREGNGDITPVDVAVATVARDFYFQPTGVIGLDTLDKFVELYSDSLFIYGAHVMVQFLADQVPVYQYIFTFEGSLDYVYDAQLPTYGFTFGPAHTDDVDYLAKTHVDEDYEARWTEDDETVRRRMCELWTNFAKTGNPTPVDQQSEVVTAEWSPVDLSSQQYMDLGMEMRMTMNESYWSRMNFWQDLVGLGRRAGGRKNGET